MPFLYLYVIASRLGEEAAILEGILLERFETLLSPILGLRLVLGEFLQQGLGEGSPNNPQANNGNVHVRFPFR